MSNTMRRLAAAQIDTNNDIAANLKKIETMLQQAQECGCDIVLFHEGCLTGYPDAMAVQHLDFVQVEQAEKRVCTLAAEMGLAVLWGTTSQRQQTVCNDVLIIDEGGRRLGRYAKTWRAGEPWYGAGSGPVIFQLCGIEASVIICHDLRYPELVRLSVVAGARIIFIANNEAGPQAENKLLGYRSMQISRATENLVYAVMANAPADVAQMKRSNASHGNSMIVDPLGNVLAQAGVFEERLVTAEINMSKATGESACRAVGDSPANWTKTYGTACEHPAYAAWLRAGVELVQRLDGEG